MGQVAQKGHAPIVLVVEGSYPYYRGGLANWLRDYLKGMAAYDFYLVTIVDKEETCGAFVYPLPPNVLGIQELVLENPSPSTPSGVEKLMGTPLTWLERILDMDRQAVAQARLALSSAPVFRNVLKWLQEAYPKEGFLDLFGLLKTTFEQLLGLLVSLKPYENIQLVHALSTGYAGYVAAYLTRSLSCPLVVSEHGLYLVEKDEVLSRSTAFTLGQKSFLRFFFGEMSRLTYQQADRVLALFQAAQLQQVAQGCPASKCRVIPNGLVWEDWRRIQLDRSDRDVVVGAVLRCIPLKNVLELLFIQATLRRQGLATSLWILGGLEDEEYFQSCQAAIERWQIEGVTFWGQVAVADYLPRLTCLVLPSLSEGQPLALLEGMAVGLPCVASSVGSCPHLLCQDLEGIGPAGICVRPGDRQGFVTAIRQIVEDENLAIALGKNGRRRVQTAYCQEQVVANYQSLYEEVGE